MKLHPPIAQHLLIELYGCTNFELNYKLVMSEMAVKTKSKPLEYIEHDYKPFGKTALLIISESHISIHTYPEYGYISCDIYTCGKTTPYLALEVIKKYFKPKYILINEIQRGVNQ